MKTPMALMSYAHRDDRDGSLTQLRKELNGVMEEVFGSEFKIFQDNDSIAVGKYWKRQIEESLDEAIFFIPIITPSFFTSTYCRDELQRFLERESKLGRDDLIFPIYYRSSPLLDDETKRETDKVAQAIHTHQYADWRDIRYESFNSPQVRRKLGELGHGIRNALDRTQLLEALANRLELSPSTAADIEHKVLGTTKEAALLEHQERGATQEQARRATSIASKTASEYDVFVSYRRQHGAETARLIRSALKERGLHTFLDVDDLRAGHFNQALLRHIAHTPNFIIILTPHALDRCADEQDWLRQEIVQAVNTNSNIVPIMMPEFQFPESQALPKDISDLRTYQSIRYSHEYFEAMMVKLIQYLR